MRTVFNLVMTAVAAFAFAASTFAQVGNGDLLDANVAERSALLALPAVDEAVADAIISGRPYLNASQLEQALVAVADEDSRQAIYARMFRHINLNAADDDEIMLIPGMSGKMAHEFEEYRPYTSLDQFRREMGKYVDAEEVARLEQYVFIPMNLNNAPLDDYKSIPGMTPKMVHEFEEYRPYKSIEQFRREIGKYVDENEVARLESYITLD